MTEGEGVPRKPTQRLGVQLVLCDFLTSCVWVKGEASLDLTSLKHFRPKILLHA
jgi:hypothetical protein